MGDEDGGVGGVRWMGWSSTVGGGVVEGWRRGELMVRLGLWRRCCRLLSVDLLSYPHRVKHLPLQGLNERLLIVGM